MIFRNSWQDYVCNTIPSRYGSLITNHRYLHSNFWWFNEIFLPYIQDPSAALRPALPAYGYLDRNGLPLIPRLTVLSAIHCSTGFALDTTEVYISDINQCLCNARHVPKVVVEVVVGGLRRKGGRGVAARLCYNVGLCSLLEQKGYWAGRVRRAHSRPYPLSCFMATVLNGTWTSINVSCRSEPSNSGRCQLKGMGWDGGVGWDVGAAIKKFLYQ